jgi:hypothetical protein
MRFGLITFDTETKTNAYVTRGLKRLFKDLEMASNLTFNLKDNLSFTLEN